MNTKIGKVKRTKVQLQHFLLPYDNEFLRTCSWLVDIFHLINDPIYKIFYQVTDMLLETYEAQRAKQFVRHFKACCIASQVIVNRYDIY